MAKRTKRKRAATSRSRSKTASKASARKRTPTARSGKAKRKSPAGSSRRSASTAAPRRRRADVEGISERGNQIVEIPTDPTRFDGDVPPDTAQLAREIADSMVGDEEPGGTVMVPDHNSVDEYAAALGVERSPDSPVRGSEEILHERDARRWPGGADPEEQRRSI